MVSDILGHRVHRKFYNCNFFFHLNFKKKFANTGKTTINYKGKRVFYLLNIPN